MMIIKRKFLLVLVLMLALGKMLSAQKPNVLWILTDDHRFDAIRAFNKMLTGDEMSKLGYVESPNIDRLTKMGTTFINTYCQAQGCAPSRTSMHMGRYPFRSGVYEFEYYNNNAEHCKPTLPEQMAALGYQTLHVGKLGMRIKTVANGQAKSFQIYQTDINFKTMHIEGFSDWGNQQIDKIEGMKCNKPLKMTDFLVEPDGKIIYISKDLEDQNPEYAGTAQAAMEKYDLLRHYNSKKGDKSPFISGILGGISPQPAGKTRDGYYQKVLEDLLTNTTSTYTIGSQTVKAIDTSKPLFCHLGFDFPHTPVLPPADYRERFKKHHYNVPGIENNELETMPKQLKKEVMAGYSDHFTDEEKQQMVSDYYAFCAYGDDLVGKSVDAFIAYSEKTNRPWVIVYVNGDHGWKLNNHGSVSKFTPWEEDAHNPIVVVSSDKKMFPAGKVVRNYTEFVDIAPTILAAGGADLKDEKYSYLDGFDLAKVVAKKAPVRDYVIGESHAVTGPRAFIRTKDFVFSMQTRPNNTRGENMNWALNASYKDLDPGLYCTKTDPKEVNNLAFDKNYEKIAYELKDKLMKIVLGDNRVEVGWGPKADGTEVYRSNFAPGAHDYKLKLK